MTTKWSPISFQRFSKSRKSLRLITTRFSKTEAKRNHLYPNKDHHKQGSSTRSSKNIRWRRKKELERSRVTMNMNRENFINKSCANGRDKSNCRINKLRSVNKLSTELEKVEALDQSSQQLSLLLNLLDLDQQALLIFLVLFRAQTQRVKQNSKPKSAAIE